jgi:hypothetical protein
LTNEVIGILKVDVENIMKAIRRDLDMTMNENSEDEVGEDEATVEQLDKLLKALHVKYAEVLEIAQATV